MSCRNCALWHGLDTFMRNGGDINEVGRRECHANPPQCREVHGDDDNGKWESAYPLTLPDDWCSQEMTVTQLLQGRHGL